VCSSDLDGYVVTYTAGALATVERLGYIPSVIIANPGSGYVTTPTATFSAPTTANGRPGVYATASVTMSNGIITAVNITNTGSGYRGGASNPTITLSGGTPTIAASVVPVVEFGKNYQSAPTVAVTGAGSGAVVSASIYGYLPTSARLTNSGSGYVSNPGVQIAGAAYTAMSDSTYARASTNGDQVTDIQIITGSSTFNTTPTISLSGLPVLSELVNNQIIGTYAVYNNMSNYVAIRISGSFTVDWGDGVTENYSANAAALSVSHSYTTASYAAISASVYNGYKPVVINITASGSGVTFKSVDFTVKPTAPTGSFGGTSTYTANSWIDIRMAGSDISSLDVGTSTSTTSPCSLLERFEYSGSNKITNFGGKFISLYNLKQIVALDTSRGTACNSMFSNCYNLASVPVLDFSAATTLAGCFSGCYNLKTISLNLGQVSSLTVANMFQNCYNLKSVNANFGSNINSYSNTFNACYNLTDIPPINVTNATTLASAFSTCYKLRSVKFIGSTSKVTSFSSTFSTCPSLIDVPQTLDCISCTDLSFLFSGCPNLTKCPILKNTSNVTTCASMFQTCNNMRYIPLFDTQNVTNMGGMFSQCNTLTTVPFFNTGKVTTMSQMFSNCFSLISVPQFNTVNVTDMSSMFQTCQSLKVIPAFNTPKLTTVTSMFYLCYSLTSVPLFDTSKVTDITQMFQSCISLEELPLFQFGLVTSFANAFSGCSSLRTVPQFNTANATSFAGIFSSCFSLQSVPPFNTTKVTTFSSAFSNCSSLKTIPLLDTSNVTTFTSMFTNCQSLQEIPALNTAAGTTFTSMITAPALKRIQMTGSRFSLDISNCSLDSTALNEIYTNLGTAAVSGSTAITVTGNWGTPNDTPSIAQAKGWVVTG